MDGRKVLENTVALWLVSLTLDVALVGLTPCLALHLLSTKCPDILESLTFWLIFKHVKYLGFVLMQMKLSSNPCCCCFYLN